jgi:hypothetical protein
MISGALSSHKRSAAKQTNTTIVCGVCIRTTSQTLQGPYARRANIPILVLTLVTIREYPNGF